jgi:hypothetical protein
MTAAQAEVLLAAIARVATEFDPFRAGWLDVVETAAEAQEIQDGVNAFSLELVNAIRAIQKHQPDVVARWRGR